MFLFPSRLQAQYVYFHNSTKRYCPLTHSDSVPDNHLFSGRENTAGSPTNCGLVYGSQYLTKELIASVVFRPPDLLKASDKNSQRPANQLASPNNALLVCEKKKKKKVEQITLPRSVFTESLAPLNVLEAKRPHQFVHFSPQKVRVFRTVGAACHDH